jgi:hypothetical protein
LSNIKRHIASHHEELAEELGLHSHAPVDGIPVSHPLFNLELWIENLITWIIVSDQALSVVDSPEFRNMIQSLYPSLPDADIPHRTMIHDRILKRYKQDRDELRKKLKESVGRVSLTSDLWSNTSMCSFMAIMLHWICRTKEVLAKSVIRGMNGRWPGSHYDV